MFILQTQHVTTEEHNQGGPLVRGIKKHSIHTGFKQGGTAELTWDHFDGSVDLFPVLSMFKLPVEDEVAVISHHRALKQ